MYKYIKYYYQTITSARLIRSIGKVEEGVSGKVEEGVSLSRLICARVCSFHQQIVTTQMKKN